MHITGQCLFQKHNKFKKMRLLEEIEHAIETASKEQNEERTQMTSFKEYLPNALETLKNGGTDTAKTLMSELIFIFDLPSNNCLYMNDRVEVQTAHLKRKVERTEEAISLKIPTVEPKCRTIAFSEADNTWRDCSLGAIDETWEDKLVSIPGSVIDIDGWEMTTEAGRYRSCISFKEIIETTEDAIRTLKEVVLEANMEEPRALTPEDVFGPTSESEEPYDDDPPVETPVQHTPDWVTITQEFELSDDNQVCFVQASVDGEIISRAERNRMCDGRFGALRVPVPTPEEFQGNHTLVQQILVDKNRPINTDIPQKLKAKYVTVGSGDRAIDVFVYAEYESGGRFRSLDQFNARAIEQSRERDDENNLTIYALEQPPF